MPLFKNTNQTTYTVPIPYSDWKLMEKLCKSPSYVDRHTNMCMICQCNIPNVSNRYRKGLTNNLACILCKQLMLIIHNPELCILNIKEKREYLGLNDQIYITAVVRNINTQKINIIKTHMPIKLFSLKKDIKISDTSVTIDASNNKARIFVKDPAIEVVEYITVSPVNTAMTYGDASLRHDWLYKLWNNTNIKVEDTDLISQKPPHHLPPLSRHTHHNTKSKKKY